MDTSNAATILQWIWIVYAVVLLWVVPWKAVALWKAARNGQKAWYVVLLLVNTVAILEILYIFKFQKKPVVKNNECCKEA
jgi:glycopeptide antibiotics resistance protein